MKPQILELIKNIRCTDLQKDLLSERIDPARLKLIPGNPHMNLVNEKGEVLEAFVYRNYIDALQDMVTITDLRIEMHLASTKKFPNGFESWHETHYEIVDMLTVQLLKDNLPEPLQEIQEEYGRKQFYTVAKQLTDEFEELHNSHRWEDLDFMEEVEKFFYRRIQKSLE